MLQRSVLEQLIRWSLRVLHVGLNGHGSRKALPIVKSAFSHLALACLASGCVGDIVGSVPAPLQLSDGGAIEPQSACTDLPVSGSSPIRRMTHRE